MAHTLPLLHVCRFYADLRSRLSFVNSLAAAEEVIRSAPHDRQTSDLFRTFLFNLTCIPDANVSRENRIMTLVLHWPKILTTNAAVVVLCAEIVVLDLNPGFHSDVNAAEAAIWLAVDKLLAVAVSNSNNDTSSVQSADPFTTPQPKGRQPLPSMLQEEAAQSTSQDVSINNTPVRANTGVLSPSKITHEQIDPYLRVEIQNAILKNVQKFHTFFPGITEQEWNCAASYNRNCSCLAHEGTVLPSCISTFPNPTKSNVVAWFTKLNEFLPNNRSFYASGTIGLADSPSDRECDIFLAPSTGISSKSSHSWRSVLVPSELKAAPQKDCAPGTILQIAGYVPEVFGAQVNRRFVHAFTICGPLFRCYLFDRAGVSISAESFNMRKNQCSLSLVVRILKVYAQMTPLQLGFDTNYTYTAGDGTISNPFMPGPDRPLPEYYTFRGRRFQLIEKLFHRPVIISRGTLCWRAREVKEMVDNAESESAQDQEWVIKDSWRTSWRKAEGDFLSLAASKGVWGIPTVLEHGQVTFPGNCNDGTGFNDGTNHIRSQLCFANAASVTLALKPADEKYLLSSTVTNSVKPTPPGGLSTITVIVATTIGSSLDDANITAERHGLQSQSQPDQKRKRQRTRQSNQVPIIKHSGTAFASSAGCPRAASSTSPAITPNTASSTSGTRTPFTSASSVPRRTQQRPLLAASHPATPAPQVHDSEFPPEPTPNHPFTDLTHAIIISQPVGKRIEKFSSIYELLCAYHDAVLCKFNTRT